jgi:LmbE family N-acetylglucosaminyl deacetylase
MRVLVIAPHMDDEVLGAGGAILRHRDRGDDVSVVIAANRAYDHRYDDTAIAAEKENALAAAKILGYGTPRFLDLPDERLDHGLQEVIIPLEEVVQEIKPDMVYTCFPGDLNQDHRPVFEASMICCRVTSEHSPDWILCYEVPSSTDMAPPFLERAFVPNCYRDIGPYLDGKIEAMAAYRRESREYPHSRSPEGVRILAQKRGIEAGLEAAEAFTLIRGRFGSDRADWP